MKKKPDGRSLGFALDARSEDPFYRQLFDQIVERIRTGALPEGFRLPPSRTLARELGAHRNTVVHAYEDLEAAGFVASTVGRGTFVAAGARVPAGGVPPARSGLPWDSLVSRAAATDPRSRLDRLTRPAPADVINLTHQQPSRDLLPEELLRRCLEQVFRVLGPRALEYSPRQGLPRLQGLIAEDLARRGVPAAAEDVW